VMHTCGGVLMHGHQQHLSQAAVAAIEGAEEWIQQQLVDPGPVPADEAAELPLPQGGTGSSSSCTLQGHALSLQEYAVRCLLAHPERYAFISGLTDPDDALAEIAGWRGECLGDVQHLCPAALVEADPGFLECPCQPSPYTVLASALCIRHVHTVQHVPVCQPAMQHVSVRHQQACSLLMPDMCALFAHIQWQVVGTSRLNSCLTMWHRPLLCLAVLQSMPGTLCPLWSSQQCRRRVSAPLRPPTASATQPASRPLPLAAGQQ
jgi:hypothetical protein